MRSSRHRENGAGSLPGNPNKAKGMRDMRKKNKIGIFLTAQGAVVGPIVNLPGNPFCGYG
jgi:hypothetical protein